MTWVIKLHSPHGRRNMNLDPGGEDLRKPISKPPYHSGPCKVPFSKSMSIAISGHLTRLWLIIAPDVNRAAPKRRRLTLTYRFSLLFFKLVISYLLPPILFVHGQNSSGLEDPLESASKAKGCSLTGTIAVDFPLNGEGQSFERVAIFVDGNGRTRRREKERGKVECPWSFAKVHMYTLCRTFENLSLDFLRC